MVKSCIRLTLFTMRDAGMWRQSHLRHGPESKSKSLRI